VNASAGIVFDTTENGQVDPHLWVDPVRMQQIVTTVEAARLGQDLTPAGAEKAGNKEGTIPAWTPAQQKGSPTELASNPQIEAEKPLFTITKANMAQYADKLDAGHRKLLQTYDTYKMNVYPSHRIETFPDAVLKATIANATTAELQGTETISNAKLMRSHDWTFFGSRPGGLRAFSCT